MLASSPQGDYRVMIDTDFQTKKVFLAVGPTDMRKSINTLSILVEESLGRGVFSDALFVFSNRSRTILKILYWDSSGFCLWMKRLEKSRFKWPKNESEVLELDLQELGWLLNGLDVRQAHERLKYRQMT